MYKLKINIIVFLPLFHCKGWDFVCNSVERTLKDFFTV